MGAPPLLVLPDPSQRRPSLSSPAFSPDSSVTSSSLSSSDFSFSSFNQSLLLPPSGDLAPTILKQEEKQQHQHHNQNAVLNVTVQHKNCAKMKQALASSYTEPFRECKTGSISCTKGPSSMRKACCRNAGAFAADCAAVCCCPCAVLSLLSFIVIDVPSALARKMAIRLQTRLCMKDSKSVRSRRGGENSLSIWTPTWSCREASDGEGEKQVVTMFRFPTQNLLEHFHVGDLGFGCLSQKRESLDDQICGPQEVEMSHGQVVCLRKGSRPS